ncbi:peptidoglycan DD-metalloendopeptidase family protein [Euryhalocaulis caribicus]|uniref:peptidoglycan DD-metalloendopeptidase family protein n=1 Tax=Euryhalocaulis caribicus TaxID=1161401 RepID=UPI00039DA234|nr:peptidoglycan DD-metalloendopeptidase family protein [Euryhalocaulis caribicus]
MMRAFARTPVKYSLLAGLGLSLGACASTPSVAPVEHRRANSERPAPTRPEPVVQNEPDLPQAVPSRSSEISAAPLSPSSASPEPLQPAPEVSSPKDTPSRITVQKGDTLFSLSERYSVPLHSMISANGLEPPYTLSVGQALTVPQPEMHVVKAGETLNEIAAKYNIDPPSLLLLNRLHSAGGLQPGQALMLPADEPMRRVASVSRPASTTTSSSAASSSSSTASTATSTPTPERTTPPARGVQIRQAKFDWPIQGRILSAFGPKSQGLQNDGVNIAAKAGDPVRAAGDGVIVYAGNELAGYGELLLVEHDGGWITAYAHNRALNVKEGDRVSRGQVIAEAGQTGSVDTPQVHFEVRQGVSPVDPMQYLPTA